ncbi:NADH-quinone oxidoreductase subunit F 2 [Ferrigenium kumadai]|uniref:NADH-quinone oxidoreductase subunit F 2 n=1 Tax=Ferrigenium kumadai TaxID=1682490 RepID=A0AAN1SZU2_9PROT|nr:NADH-ubiquinone oxidoreductase-F iron-sulfur binding region domain-containing protein [Ferrigenium kumadai]BBI99676.1 NADH-quinone oxidoreductase subunit F 2 [Ferrigenium kumadai]
MEILNTNLLHPRQRVGEHMQRWQEAGGGEALRIAVRNPASVLASIKDADLRGLGGSGFPVWRKWEAVANETADPDKYLVCNGNEDEPGTFKDRLLLEETPHQIIEGALLAALACGISRIVFYINPDLTRSLAALKAALAQWQDGELLKLASDALGKTIRMELVPGSSHYIGGEETAAMEWIEGRLSGGEKFPFPRGKPPYPAQCGIYGCPTLINNIETLAHIPAIVRNGADWFRKQGIGRGAGTKLYSLSGDVLHPGVYELPMGTTLRDLIFVHGGGLLSGKPLKAVFTGGPSNTLLTPDDLDVNLDFESLRERGGSLGTGAMIVVSDGTGMVKRVAEYARFFAHSSCGQCPSCKTGTATISRLLDRIDTGRGTTADLATLETLCRMLPGSGRCHLVNGVVHLLDSSFLHFRHEYQQALK